jgi:putative ABC transport system substrate-binding protein
MRRREFIEGLGAAAAWPVTARAQRAAVPIVGFLNSESPEARPERFRLAPFHRGLAEIGFVEGRSVAIEYRWAEGHYDQLPDLARELVRSGVAVIVENNSSAILATKAATKTVPIVFMIGSDPVENGLVASLSRPGGNVTGVTLLNAAVTAKRLELLHELAPAVASVAFLVNPTNPLPANTQTREVQVAAHALGLNVLVLNASTPSEIDTAFATLVRERVGSFLVDDSPFFRTQGDKLAELAERHALPAIYAYRQNVAAGGLMSYAADLAEAWHQVGIYTGRILKGEKPADLPIQQATKLELVINVRAAKALGLTIPETLLATADDVIQ